MSNRGQWFHDSSSSVAHFRPCRKLSWNASGPFAFAEKKKKERIGKSRTDVQKKPVGVNYRLVSTRLSPESDDFD